MGCPALSDEPVAPWSPEILSSGDTPVPVWGHRSRAGLTQSRWGSPEGLQKGDKGLFSPELLLGSRLVHCLPYPTGHSGGQRE